MKYRSAFKHVTRMQIIREQVAQKAVKYAEFLKKSNHVRFLYGFT